MAHQTGPYMTPKDAEVIRDEAGKSKAARIVMRRGKAHIRTGTWTNDVENLREVDAKLFGPYWCVTLRSAGFPASLTHIPSGLALSPHWTEKSWGVRLMERAARLLAAQGEVWNLTREQSKDLKGPKMLACRQAWEDVCKDLGLRAF